MTTTEPESGGRSRTLRGPAPSLRVLMVASEVAPFSKTGGLGDVMGGLPPALAEAGHDVTVVVPKHRGSDAGALRLRTERIEVGDVASDVAFELLEIGPRHRVIFIDCPEYFDRPGLYGDEHGRDYADSAERFAVLSASALSYGESDPAGPYDVVHAHDWQAALALTLLSTAGSRWPRLAAAGRVFTIHNLAYQGLFPRETVPRLGLPWSAFTMTTGEFWGQFNSLKAGIHYSDWVTTVSPAYARETLTPAFGCGLEGVLSARGDRYVGILNGIDDRVWDPEHDAHLPARYTRADRAGKLVCKRTLAERFGLPVGDDAMARPVVGLVSRLVDQKGLDLVKAASPTLVGLDATWVFVGSGENRYERWLQHLANVHPSRVGVFIGFNEPLAHLVEGGADLFLMPSRFEPCGLNQMYSLRYGTVPVVRSVGGLDDTVQPYTARARRANGFKFREATPDALVRTVRHALRLYHDKPVWDRLVRQGMSEDHSWRRRARDYVRVYRRARHERGERSVQRS